MNTQYTPGPWQFKKVSVWAPTKPTEGIPVFEFCFTGGEEWMRTARANARLIAAAPELLEACIEGLRAMRALGWDQGRLNDPTQGNFLAYQKAEQAISKATNP